MKLSIWYNKLGIRVPSQVAKELKIKNPRELENIGKSSNLNGDIAQCSVSHREITL